MSEATPDRRQFLGRSALAIGSAAISTTAPFAAFRFNASARAEKPQPNAAAKALEKNALADAIGITTGSFVKHLTPAAAPGKLVLLDLPAIMRDELDLRVIDLMTATLPSLEPAYCEKFRQAAADAGCVITNLKMNQKGLELASPNEETRCHALDVYKKTIDSAARLGCRWVRPLPGPTRPDMALLVAGYRELIEYAAPKGISLLVENFGWMQRDPSAIPQIIAAVRKEAGEKSIASQPDTGNWHADFRYEGLQQAFPFAASCDFKALKLDERGEHHDYDLRRCFDIGWQAGFRGPWCFEHFHDSLPELFREFKLLRDRLRQWMSKKER